MYDSLNKRKKGQRNEGNNHSNTASLSGNNLLLIQSIKEKSELLEWQISNNSIVSVDEESDSDDLNDSDAEMF